VKRRSVFVFQTLLLLGFLSPQCVEQDPKEIQDVQVDSSVPEEDVDSPAFTQPPDCNPLAPDIDCLLPFPSDVFRVPDKESPSGFLVQIPDPALVELDGQGPVNIPAAYPSDGFSVDTPILVLLGKEIDAEGLVFHSPDPGQSLSPSSPTVLLDGVTGMPVLHFAELDMRPEAEGRRVMMIRPMDRLEDGRRYVVGIHGVRDPEGAVIEAPSGFQQSRDGDVEGDPTLVSLAARYEQGVFGLLEDHGIVRDSLQLAWEFTTRSEESATGDMLRVVEDALGRLDEEAPAVTIDSVEDSFESGPIHFQEHVARIIRGHMTVPLYLDSTEPEAHLYRNELGDVVANGVAEVAFTVLVPSSVLASVSSENPAPILQYGHGFFGTRSEAEGKAVVVLADRLGAVVIAANWWGLSKEDMPVIVGKLVVDTADLTSFTDRLHQAMVNYIALAHACGTTLMQVEELQEEGVPFFDGEEVFFYGNSVGHVLGGTYVALSPHIQRAVLGVGGASIPLMMSRSTNFAGFLLAFQLFLEDSVDVVKLVALFASSINRIDPITYAPYVLKKQLPWAPANRRVLMQLGMADSQVPNLSSHLHARALDLFQVVPAPREIFGLSVAEVGEEGMDISAVIEVDFHIDPDPTFFAELPDENNCVHEGVRGMKSMQDQIVAFLRGDQRVIHPCGDPCEESCEE
jgi:hypothetical protein